ncbi:hypothetical protein KLP28_14350 [Nocardioidaceae bacterium]|nr:hypothetical protein KLP28_14350 [Nocardioidaceae bacterium]
MQGSQATVPASVHLPSPTEVREVLGALVGKPVELQPAAALVPSTRSVCSVGTYADESGRTRAVAVLDRSLTVRLGAALSLLPRQEAEELVAAAGRGEPLGEELGENVEEVLNVLATAFNAVPGVHVKLHAFHVAGTEVPQQTRMGCYSLGRREDHEVSVEGYGTGRLALVLVS